MKIYQHIGMIEVIPPVGPDFPLTTDVPDIQLEPFGLNGFYVETLSRCDVCHVLCCQFL